MTNFTSRGFVIVRIAAAILLLVALGCTNKVSQQVPDVVWAPARSTGVSCNSNGAVPGLNCAPLPNTTAVGQWVDVTGTPLTPQPANGQAATNAYLDYDLWAWNSFVAMNWPALDPATNNNQRGFPDQTKSFSDAQPADTAVWETYKEKREVSFSTTSTTRLRARYRCRGIAHRNMGRAIARSHVARAPTAAPYPVSARSGRRPSCSSILSTKPRKLRRRRWKHRLPCVAAGSTPPRNAPALQPTIPVVP